MKTVGELIKYPTIVLYGPSGAGKTTLAATIGKPFVLDSNKGLLSIHERPGFEHVRGEDVTSLKTLESAYSNFSGTGTKNYGKMFNAIVFDHFNDIQQIVMEGLGDKRHKKDERKDADEAEQRDYGIMGSKLRRIIRKFKKLPVAKVLICGEKENKTDGRMTPNLVGALQGELPFFADHTMYLTIAKKGKRILYLDSREEFYAKTRAWWFTPEQRRIEVPFDDTKFLATLVAQIAAGPSSKSTPRAKDK